MGAGTGRELGSHLGPRVSDELPSFVAVGRGLERFLILRSENGSVAISDRTNLFPGRSAGAQGVCAPAVGSTPVGGDELGLYVRRSGRVVGELHRVLTLALRRAA